MEKRWWVFSTHASPLTQELQMNSTALTFTSTEGHGRTAGPVSVRIVLHSFSIHHRHTSLLHIVCTPTIKQTRSSDASCNGKDVWWESAPDVNCTTSNQPHLD